MQKRAASHLANTLSFTYLAVNALIVLDAEVTPVRHTPSYARPRALPSEHVSGAENGAERAENRVTGSGAVSGHSRKRLSGAEHGAG